MSKPKATARPQRGAKALREPLSVMVNPDTTARLDRLAASLDLSRGRIIDRAIRELDEREEKP